MSTTFLKFLPFEMSQITQFKEPFLEIRPTDTVVDDMTKDQKALYTIMSQYHRQALLLAVDLQTEGDTPDLCKKYPRLK